jgi:5-methyltetrahydrofolate--homocysteine methyltransferase
VSSIANTIEALTEAGVRSKVKVIIGGAPITQDFANKVGADGFAPDAGSVARMAKNLLGLA